MKIFISSPSDAVLTELARRCPGLKLNILLTMARMPSSNIPGFFQKHGAVIESSVLDCGAFSLNKSNLGITADQLFTRLAAYALADGGRYEMVFSMDDTFGPDAFDANHLRLQELERLGLNVVPVIHNLKNHEVQTYINRGHEYIAIGQAKNRTIPMNLFPPVYKMHASGVKVHLFGITDFFLISLCPAYSCDSKSWIDDSKTGVVRFWNPNKPEVVKIDLIYFPKKQDGKKAGTWAYTEYPDLDAFIDFIENRLGLTILEFIGKEKVLNCQMANILFYKILEEEVTKIHLGLMGHWVQ